MRPERWLKAAGFGTWIASGVPAMLALAGGRMTGARAATWVIAYVAFGIAFGISCTPRGRGLRGLRVLLAAQSFAGLVMVAASRDGLAAATLVVAAAQLVGPFSPRIALIWVIAQTTMLVIIFSQISSVSTGLTGGGAFLGFQLFALATAGLAVRERESREELARANAELIATRALLAENSRVAERLRISRDLHDTLGHHLTALSLQLEVASRLALPPAVDRVLEAHAITRLLLSDVRDVVSRLRETSRFDLAQAVRTLAGSAATLEVHVEVPEDAGVDDPGQAHAILRCVQEAITNATRHAGARNLWITIERQADGVALTARDDGRGSDIVEWGHGLRGMSERFEELGGHVEFSSAAGRGFTVSGFLPRDASERSAPKESATEAANPGLGTRDSGSEERASGVESRIPLARRSSESEGGNPGSRQNRDS